MTEPDDRRRPAGINRWLMPVALAASVVLGVNLGWNVYKAEPPGGLASREEDVAARRKAEATESLGKAKASMARVPEQAKEQEPKLAAEEGRAAPAPIPSEPEKIARLIAFVGQLQGATFIRNDKEHSAVEAAKHLQLKRDKAGDRVRSAADFIRLCASHSSLSGEAYLIRFADGRTRTAEDVLREELARIESAQ